MPTANSLQDSTSVGLAASLGSGVSEEVFVVAAPIALLSAWLPPRGTGPRARVLTAVVLVVLSAARLSYHVYYGPTALVLLPWAVLSVWWYLRTRAVLPLMICHVGYDAVLQLPGLLGLLAVLAGAVLAVLVGRATVRRWRVGAAPPPSGRPWPVPAPGWPPPGPVPPPAWDRPAPPGPGRDPTAPSPSGPRGRSGRP